MVETTGYNIGVIGFILGFYWDNGKEMETTGYMIFIIGYIFGGYIGIMEKKMETTTIL